MQVFFYKTLSGRCPVRDDLDKLPVEAAAHAYELLQDIETLGADCSRVRFRIIRGKLWEIKMALPKIGGHRIFYSMISGGTMLLLESFQKKSRKAPIRHIETAMQRLEDALNRGV